MGLQGKTEINKSGGKGRKRVDFASTWGWVISLVIHLVVLIVLSLIIVNDGKGLGAGEMEVGIIGGGGAEEIGFDEAGTRDISQESAQFGSVLEQSSVEVVEDSLLEISIDVEAGDLAQGAMAAESLQQGSQWGAMADVDGGGALGEGGRGGGSFFGLEVEGSRFIYVVDKSGSMSGDDSGPLGRAKQELINSISELEDYMEFCVIFYSNGFEVMPGGGLISASDFNKSKCFKWIEKITAAGGTDPTSAMKTGLAMRPDAIWLLSDGAFGVEMADQIFKDNKGKGVAVHTIGFINASGEEQLRKIAKQNRGRYRFVSGRKKSRK